MPKKTTKCKTMPKSEAGADYEQMYQYVPMTREEMRQVMIALVQRSALCGAAGGPRSDTGKLRKAIKKKHREDAAVCDALEKKMRVMVLAEQMEDL